MKCRFEDVEVYYEVFGTGEDDTPLVFLHGWGGSTKSFEYFAKAMCSCRKVVLIDLPPFGNSTESKNVWNVDKYGPDSRPQRKPLKIRRFRSALCQGVRQEFRDHS